MKTESMIYDFHGKNPLKSGSKMLIPFSILIPMQWNFN